MTGAWAASEKICCLNRITNDELPVRDGWQRYLKEKVKRLQTLLSSTKLRHEMVSKQLEPFFKSVVLGDPSEDCDLESMHLFIENLIKSRSISLAFESTLSIYLASRLLPQPS